MKFKHENCPKKDNNGNIAQYLRMMFTHQNLLKEGKSRYAAVERLVDRNRKD